MIATKLPFGPRWLPEHALLLDTTTEQTSFFSVERCGRNREGHLEVARLSRDGAATTCGSERESRELPGDMRIVAGHGVFETKDVPDI